MPDFPPIIAVEEHLSIPALADRLDPVTLAAMGWPQPSSMPALFLDTREQLADVSEGRLAAMNRAGIAVQVLSLAGPPADMAVQDGGLAYARDCNDHLSSIARAHPDRFAAFAYLPTHFPEQAADELERTVRDLGFCGALVCGTVKGRFLDHPSFEPLLARAEALEVPIFLHPGLPPVSVQQAYYSDLPPKMSFILATYGWGWHSEVAIHALRLVVSGVFDRFPRLQFIIGHMGEGLPAMIERIDQSFVPEASHLAKLPSTYLREHFHVAISGFCSAGGFTTLLDSFGEDRILFAADYPMMDLMDSVEFLRSRALPSSTLRKIACDNAARLLGLPQTIL